MGFAKEQFNSEPETQQTQHRRHANSSEKRQSKKGSGMSLGRVVAEPKIERVAEIPLWQKWARLKRSFTAFCYQANRYTLGVVRYKNHLGAAFVLAIAYVSFCTEDGFQGLTEMPTMTEQGVITPLEEPVGELAKPKKAKPAKTKSRPEPAPVEASELMSEQTRDYVERFHDIAVSEMKKFGIPASISLAQGLIESRAGASKLAVKNNNHFGIKCFKKNCPKGHCSNFEDDHHKDFFRKFKNPWESWRAHSQLLASGRYAKLKKYGRDYRKWAYGLKSVGYATDRTYAEKLIGVIERYELYRYDR